jgi:flagellar biosynthesis/type III secretory pathway protein FliH
MSIIRGAQITEMATLTPTGELNFSESSGSHDALLKEECHKAFCEGQQIGERIGYERAMEEMKALANVLHSLAVRLFEQRAYLLDKLKPEIIEFALAVCERVIRKELSQPEVLVRLINSLLSVSAVKSGREMLQIVLSPDDLAMLEDYLDQIAYDQKKIEGINLKADPLVSPGDCRIEWETGLLNHSIVRELADLNTKILQR